MPADDRAPFSGLLFIAQIIAVPLLSIALGSLLTSIVDLAPLRLGDYWPVALTCYGSVGFSEGYLIEKISGSAEASGGCFVWAPLLCLIVIIVLRHRLGVGSAIGELLTWSPHSIKGIASVFLTMPAWACSCYSFGVYIANRTLTEI